MRMLLVILLSLNSYALMVLDIEITHEKVLGTKTILKSELMSSESVHSGKEVVLQMQNGIQVRVTPTYQERFKKFTPESMISIHGILQNLSIAKKKPKEFNLSAKLGSPAKVKFETGEGQNTTVVITPREK
jgi:hypothetical protein